MVDFERMSNLRRRSFMAKATITNRWKNGICPFVVVFGASGVGKTSIIHQLLNKPWPSEHKPTVEDMYSYNYDESGSKIQINILDTSGQDEYPAMRRVAIQKADIFILIFSIDSEESFQRVSTIRDSILEIQNTEEQDMVPIVIVGNKCELEESRQVSKAITESIVTMDWQHGFIEVSAKDRINIRQIFTTALSQADICHSVKNAEEQRRTSLPVQSNYSKSSNLLIQKRNSCKT
ncbi:GTP-binding protein Rhes [Trichonephila inaurata madagascariensis]|uniref:GTP-binding protein Rhes n=1 Tax=Trichonephila inaurata madagascariensis TaxID=2747483 RepID=A0A8X7BTN5_9ARAC|nr:GTP-binding protein Rhes [Trichonephila inaurata madagascariensis]